MEKWIDIDYYFDGYSFSQFGCVEIPIAASTGFYRYDNYYLYLAYHSFFYNWGNMEDNNFHLFRKNIMNRMGLDFVAHTLHSPDELIGFIKEKIDGRIPIIAVFKYNALFFYHCYLDETSGTNGMLIYGYNPGNRTISVKDSSLTDLHVIPRFGHYVKGTITYSFKFKEEMIREFWERSNVQYERENSEFRNVIYTVERLPGSRLIGYSDFVKDVVANFGFSNDRIISGIKSYNLLKDRVRDGTVWKENLKMTSYGSLFAFFDTLEKGFEHFSYDGPSHADFIRTRDGYLKFRLNLVNRIIKDMFRDRAYDEETVLKLTRDVEAADEGLLGMLLDKLEKEEAFRSAGPQISNIAREAKVTADSSYEFCTPDRVVNGAWNSWTHDIWQSGSDIGDHWLRLDFDRPRELRRFVVRHDGRMSYNTREFAIQGSQDGEKWEVIDSRSNNIDPVTYHNIDPASYRYIRLYITNPSDVDYYARIMEFEAFGR